MPQPLVEYLSHLQEQLLRAPVLQSGSVLYEVLSSGWCDRHRWLCACQAALAAHDMHGMRRLHKYTRISCIFICCAAGGGCQFLPGDMTLAHNIIAAYAAQVCVLDMACRHRARMCFFGASDTRAATLTEHFLFRTPPTTCTRACCHDVAQAVKQAQLVAWALQQQPVDGASFAADYHQQCAWLMDKVVLHHVDVCFGVPMEAVVGCVLYVTAKVLQAAVSFSTITQVRPCLNPARLVVLVGAPRRQA